MPREVLKRPSFTPPLKLRSASAEASTFAEATADKSEGILHSCAEATERKRLPLSSELVSDTTLPQEDGLPSEARHRCFGEY